MSKHLSYRSGNPALQASTFRNTSTISGTTMTLEGTINKTSLSLLVLMLTAFYTWNNPSPLLMVVGAIGGFIVAMITIFKKHLAPYTTLIYSALEGLFLGGISKFYEMSYGDGIVGQAIFLTFTIFAALLFAYKSKIIKPTENFKLGIFAATSGIFVLYLVNMVMSFFGSSIPLMNPSNASLFSIGFSVFVVVIASLNLVLDFDFIEEGAENGAPKYMEWYGAFGLLITLVWLYLEILRLLAKLQSRR
tara:strand:- start:416 stop:1159 length:744 start_codon:yes stop_codon:yes gene_type:complete